MKQTHYLKRLASVLLVLCMIIISCIPVWAEDANSQAEEAEVYQELEQVLEDVDESEYDGFIVSIREDLSARTEKKIDNAVAAESHMDDIPFADGLYVADDIETIQETIDDNYIVEITPNYHRTLVDVDPTLEAATLQSATSPNDNRYSYQYNLKNLNVPYAWQLGLEGQDLDTTVDLNRDGNRTDDIIVAVIDSGLISNHRDINYSNVLPGRFFKSVSSGWSTSIQVSADVTDEHGHGTFCAGIIMATKDNSLDIAGIAPKVKLLPLKIFYYSGGSLTTTDAAIIAAINYAVEQGASVINMSLGGTVHDSALQKACEDAMDAGVLIVCAAGNDYDTYGNMKEYPAQYTMGVGAVNSSNTVTSWSQRLSRTDGTGFERKVWVTAPGNSVYSLGLNGTYTTNSGTSFASPEVAALAALCKSIDNNMDQDEFMALLKKTATFKTGNSGTINGQSVEYGWGLVDFQKTIKEIYNGSSDGGNTGGDSHTTHVWDNGVVTKAPGTYTTGIMTYTCTVCGATKTEVIPATGGGSTHKHSLTRVNATASTCTTQGNYAYYKCTTCGKVFSDAAGTRETTVAAMTMPALGHNYGSWKYLNSTYHYRVCSRDSSHYETAAHSYTSYSIVRYATRYSYGIVRYYCDCGATKTYYYDYYGRIYG